MGQRVVGSQSRERHGCADGPIKLSRIAQRANQPMMRFDVRRVGSDGGAERIRCLLGAAFGEQVEASLGVRVGCKQVSHGWF